MSTYLKDLFERIAATYVEAFAGLLIASEAFADGVIALSVIETAGVAAIPAALAVVKGAAAKRIGKRRSASTTKDV